MKSLAAKLILGLGLTIALSSAVVAQPTTTQCVSNAQAGGSADALTVPLLPCGLATNLLILTVTQTNVTSQPTLVMQGAIPAFSALPIHTATGAAPGAGSLVANSLVLLTGTGTDWRIIGNGGGGGAICLSGSPMAGNLTKWYSSSCITNGDLSGIWCSTSGTLALSCPFVPLWDANQDWTASQAVAPSTLAISGSTFTPSFNTSNNFFFQLSHSACPCTLANPSSTPVAGQVGVIEIKQSSTGSDLISTWGSDYYAAGGTAALTLSTAGNAIDFLTYYVADSTHVVLSIGALNATH